jgi:glycosyltransferase involved in cell wall biosynthesis
MKILFFSYVDLDTPNACQAHTLGVLGGFAANGCQVDAVVPLPISLPMKRGRVRFHFLTVYHGGRRYLLREVLHSAFVLWSLCRRHQYDSIYARDMDVFVGPRLCSRFFGIPLYLEVDDTPVEGTYPPLISKAVEVNLKLDYRRAAGLIVPSVPRCRIINQRFGIPLQKIHLILNGTEELDWGRIPTKAEAKQRLGLPVNSFCLGYLGTVYERYDFVTMLAAMAACLPHIRDLVFIIVGSGPGLEQVKGEAAALGLADRVLLTGFLQQEEFARVLPAMDVGLMSLTKVAVLEHGPIHTKMATYASFTLPVITAGYSLEGYPEEVRRGVWLVPPEDAESLAAMILRLYQNPVDGEMRAQSLRRYVMQRLTWQAVASGILAIMEKSWKPPTAV